MADATKFLTLSNLSTYDGKIKEYIKDEVVLTGYSEGSNLTSGYLKTYKFTTKSGRDIGTIDIPKDLVVTEGKVETYTEGALPAGVTEAGTYLKLTIANQKAPVYIDVKKMAEVLKAAQGATSVQLDISGTNEISATIVDSAVETAKIKDSAVTTDKIDGKAVTTAKIDDKAVTVTQLGDSAVETAKINDSAVTEAKLAADSVTVDKIKDGEITLAKINTDSIASESDIIGLFSTSSSGSSTD